MSVRNHKKAVTEAVRCMVITVSDTRDEETDKSGALMKELLKSSGHEVTEYVIVKDDRKAIQDAVTSGSRSGMVDVILTNGGTGIAKRDVTIEAVKELMTKEIPGFGEIFRMLSYQEDIGAAAILSRAIAGVVNNKAVFSTPGSSGAVLLAMNKLILPELGHVVGELRKDL
ncbi:MogA/MoaB family molybdenum cofactor biosynthesis protein [Peribacillus frigoritolerans]|uniref:MogA/MoaB family molybdenum cofactor biosynthesis protein n=1 Tax=Peribacillus frigoritolerans TaxID=450367 RepID=UPI0020793C8E|nr:MogA/MoaB family molybdenum cofactor biosynthesis protein [Peribacillus frigoritolerans]USK79061.1 MogA/MoaB family molybdenum cofactor biosynthesis protein [Peribacillus frigoritolerans]WJE46365.1 MogA/MoaB family molybdenum cofactor biosynthesis protein [Peribacillus frigoritolerans]